MLPAARHFRLKSAQQELIAACGGIVRAAEICGYSKTVVGRWNNEDSPEWMDLAAADRLEAAIGKPIFTRAWLDCRGLRLAEDDAEPAARDSSLTVTMAAMIGDFSAVMAEWAATSADGHATPAEMRRVVKLLPKLKERIAALEALAAGVNAAGGISLVKGDVA